MIADGSHIRIEFTEFDATEVRIRWPKYRGWSWRSRVGAVGNHVSCVDGACVTCVTLPAATAATRRAARADRAPAATADRRPGAAGRDAFGFAYNSRSAVRPVPSVRRGSRNRIGSGGWRVVWAGLPQPEPLASTVRGAWVASDRYV